MNVYPNLTLVVLQLIPFLITIFALNSLILKPMLQYLDERDEKSGGAENNAEEINASIDSKLAHLAEVLKQTQQEAATIKEEARSQAAAEYTAAIHSFRKNADQRVRDAAASIDQEQQAARQELRGQVEAIASEIASKALGRRIA